MRNPTLNIPTCFDHFLLQWDSYSSLNEARIYINRNTGETVLEIRYWSSSAVKFAINAGSHEIIFQKSISPKSEKEFIFYLWSVLQRYECPKEKFQHYLNDAGIDINIY